MPNASRKYCDYPQCSSGPLDANHLPTPYVTPADLRTREEVSEDMKQHAIRWTENLFSVKDYLVQKKGVASYQIDELFKSVGLPKNLDIE